VNSDLILKSVVHDVDICDDNGIVLTFHHGMEDYSIIVNRIDIIGIDDIR
jgi:hypothetical protein